MGVFGTIDRKITEAVASKLSNQYSQQLNSMMSVLGGSLPTINPDGADYYQIFKNVGAVYEATDTIAKKFIACPIVFYKVKDKKKLQQSKSLEKTDPIQAHILKALAIEEVDDNGLRALLDNPNPYQTGTQLAWTNALAYLLQGNSFLYGNKVGKKVKELYCFPNMTIEANDSNLLDPIVGYILQNTNQTPFHKEDIYHLKTGNPAPIDRTFEYLYGVAPLRAYLESIRTIKEAKTQSSKQAKNGGVFGVLSPQNKEDQLDSAQKQQLKEKMSQARRSDDEMARVFPSTIALNWQSIGLKSADLELLGLIDTNEEAVYRAFHVPLTFHNQKASTDNNVGTEVKKLIYDAVAPLCKAESEAYTRFIGPGYGDIIIERDYTQLPEMAVNMGEVADYLNKVPKGTLTYNEMRSALRYGEKTEAYMNEHYCDAGLSTLKRVFDGTNNANTEL